MKAFFSPVRSLALVATTAALHASCYFIADGQLEGKPVSSTSTASSSGMGGGGAGGTGGVGNAPCGGMCVGNETCCTDACFDLETSAEHCGTCDKACAAGEKCCGGGVCAACCTKADCPNSDFECLEGTCVLQCNPPETDCVTECADLQSTTNHCGTCANDCLSGHKCNLGECQPGWAKMNENGPLSPRQRAAAVWTGSKLFVWGGQDTQGALGDGGLYDPKTDTWTLLTTVNAPSARADAVAVLTDKGVMVWGGGPVGNNVGEPSGKLYDLVTSEWKDIPTAPIGRRNPIATWTGSKVVIWGGTSGGAAIANGAYYDPTAAKWTQLNNAGSPTARTGVGWAWSGQELLLFGGRPGGVGSTAEGYGYNPETDTWRKLKQLGPQYARYDTFAAWTGAAFLIYGGRDVATTFDDALLYDPVADVWTSPAVSLLGKRSAPAPRTGWASTGGPKIFIAGGLDEWEAIQVDGQVYDSTVNDWGAQIPAWESMADHEYGVCVWTGTELILWSGIENAMLTPVGERYRP